MIEIRNARTDDDISAATTLAWEFVAFLQERYPEMNAEIQAYLERQDFAGQLSRFPQYFNPPAGECVLAFDHGVPAGTVMLKAGGDEVCEMNRMFVRPAARGLGIGRKLCTALIAEARKLRYSEIRLSALFRHYEALPLYRSLGFVPCEPFGRSGSVDDPRVIFMRLDLRHPGLGLSVTGRETGA